MYVYTVAMHMETSETEAQMHGYFTIKANTPVETLHTDFTDQLRTS